MSNLPLLGKSDLNVEQQDLWDYIVKGPRGASLGESIKFLPGPFNPWMQIPSFGKLAAEMGGDCGFTPNSQASTASSQS